MIRIDHLAKRYGDASGLGPLSEVFAAGSTTVIIGPSGCGKTTLLRLLLGLVVPDSGWVRYDDETLTPATVNVLRHRIGYVIQEGGLFPHLTALQNAALLARYLKRSEEFISVRVRELAELVQLSVATLNRYPRELSGGQRQRVALMRALMLDPPFLLLDEPLGALDPITRYALQSDLKAIFTQLGKTVVFVTHDLHEAAHFADDVMLLAGGQVVQRGTLDDLLDHPATSAVREFVRAQRVDERLARATQ